MPLQSKHFTPDPTLEACLIRDAAHVMPGAVGDHVRKIQAALKLLDNLTIAQGELNARQYGPSTSAAVLAFKKKRRIINAAYQRSEDNIVGKMTIAALDQEMLKKERGSGGPSVSADMQIVIAANLRRLSALASAEAQILQLKRSVEPAAPEATEPVVAAMQRQLFVNLDSQFWGTLNTLLSFIQRNRAIQAPLLIDKTNPDFAHVDASNQPAKGVTLCASFFATTDNCRQEVITHEFFHFIVGLQHFYGASTLAEAMRCPHHLARVVFDIAVGQQLAPCDGSSSVCR